MGLMLRKPPRHPDYTIDSPQSKRKSTLPRTLLQLFIATLIFLSGFGIGSGKIVISKDQLFTQPVPENHNIEDNLDYSSVEAVYDALRNNFDGELNNEDLLTGIKKGLAEATGDPYTEFFDPEGAKAFNEQLTGTFTGIGAELSKDEDGNVIVVAPISGFPAEAAGLLPQDIIVKVDDEAIAGMNLSDVVGKIRGPENTDVKLTIVRDRAEQLDITITRAVIKIPSVEYEIRDDNIGYIKISRYAEDTTSLTKQAANEFKSKNVKGIILDLRNDPGGLLDAAVSVSSLWLDPGSIILKEKRADVVVKTYNAKGTPILKGMPTIVLINGGSASASEITAGALRDNGAATLIGEKSFGKGSVQRLENFEDGSFLKVTIARWYTPNDVNIDEEGIEPDEVVEITKEDIESKKDPQLESALSKLR